MEKKFFMVSNAQKFSIEKISILTMLKKEGPNILIDAGLDSVQLESKQPTEITGNTFSKIYATTILLEDKEGIREKKLDCWWISKAFVKKAGRKVCQMHKKFSIEKNYPYVVK